MKKISYVLLFSLINYTTFSQNQINQWCSTTINSHSVAKRDVKQDQLVWDEIKAYDKRVNFNIAVILIDYQDIPQNYRSKWPTKNDWERTLFHSKIQKTFSDLSNDKFTITGDVFDYQTSSSVYWDSNTDTTIPFQEVLNNTSFSIPGFDINKYDEVVFISSHDAILTASNVGSYSYTINGQVYNRGALVLYYINGRPQRNASLNEANTLLGKKTYVIATADDVLEENDVLYDLSQTEATFCHELGHALGIGAHANSRTNGASFDYEPEIANNGSFYNNEYGNSYDMMGDHDFSPSLNGHFRDYVGLLPQENIETVNEIGTKTVTIFPINSTASKRYLEVLLPFHRNLSVYKELGYAIEVRKVDEFDVMLNHPQLSNNVNGVFVHKMDGLSSQLIDMSPSPNYTMSWGLHYDIRDVVLKPGMIYENANVKFNNVVQNNDGSFTLDVEIKNAKQETPAPTALTVTRLATTTLQVTWENNHLTSGNDGHVLIQYRNFGQDFWQNTGQLATNATIFTTGFGTGVNDVVEFRIRVAESPTNLPSRPSNVISYNCNLTITNLVEYPVNCNGESTGKIEVFASGGLQPYEYKIAGGTFSNSNIITGLSSGTHNIVVKDAKGCEVNKTSTHIPSPQTIVIDYELDGTTLTVKPNYGTGKYQYKLNTGAWVDNPVFQNVSNGFTIAVKDQKGCEVSKGSTLGIDTIANEAFKIFPNPATNEVFISNSNVIKQVKVFDLLGKLVVDYNFEAKEVKIDISNLGSGIYIIKVININNIQGVKKLVVN